MYASHLQRCGARWVWASALLFLKAKYPFAKTYLLSVFKFYFEHFLFYFGLIIVFVVNRISEMIWLQSEFMTPNGLLHKFMVRQDLDCITDLWLSLAIEILQTHTQTLSGMIPQVCLLERHGLHDAALTMQWLDINKGIEHLNVKNNNKKPS